MIRSTLLASFFLPALALANTGAATSVQPCGASLLAPLPTTLPTVEMMRPAPAVVACVNLLSYTERLRRPASAAPAATAAAAGPAYVPKTAHDNTPWRFDMNQNGRRMTAEEFDAWMKAKGIRVATGRAPTPAAAPAPAPAPAAAAPGGCVPSATVKC